MASAACGRHDCPVVPADTIDRRRLRVVVIDPEHEFFRAVQKPYREQTFTPAGIGNGRFSPLTDRGHSYVADVRSAALLESALHEADGPNPRMYTPTLHAYVLQRVRFTEPLRLLDLRDDALADLSVRRDELIGSSAAHYGCTRKVAQHLVGAKGSHGLLWTSRQGTLHAQRNPDGLASEVLHHDNLDAAVIYEPDYSGGVELVDTEPLVVDNTPTRFVLELANLLRIAIL